MTEYTFWRFGLHIHGDIGEKSKGGYMTEKGFYGNKLNFGIAIRWLSKEEGEASE